MKEQILTQNQEENELVIHIQLTRGLAAVLVVAMLVIAFLSYLALDQQEASASSESPQVVQSGDLGLRKYYQTKAGYLGANADGTDGNGAGVCDAGYHFASLWEILEPSNLEYDTALGDYLQDAGKSSPSGSIGWVRTGYYNDIGGTAGRANCNNWSTSDGASNGTGVYLNFDWAAAEDIHVWKTELRTCADTISVWCIED